MLTLCSILGTTGGNDNFMIYKLKQLRVEKAMTQEELALKSRISRATISKIENGEEVEVKVSTLLALAQALECSLADFLC